MITLDLWKTIIIYIDKVKTTVNVEAILICGSLPNNKFKEGSDIDLLFLTDKEKFSMETVLFNGYIFDTMISSESILQDVLLQKSSLSDVLSLSLGLTNLIIEDSKSIKNLISTSEENIKNRDLSYKRSENKAAHVLNEKFKISKSDGVYELVKV
ncbi:MAG: nucleotidyltransferase domain-containing protein [Spirochaetaceae bacterium]